MAVMSFCISLYCHNWLNIPSDLPSNIHYLFTNFTSLHWQIVLLREVAFMDSNIIFFQKRTVDYISFQLWSFHSLHKILVVVFAVGPGSIRGIRDGEVGGCGMRILISSHWWSCLSLGAPLRPAKLYLFGAYMCALGPRSLWAIDSLLVLILQSLRSRQPGTMVLWITKCAPVLCEYKECISAIIHFKILPDQRMHLWIHMLYPW